MLVWIVCISRSKFSTCCWIPVFLPFVKEQNFQWCTLYRAPEAFPIQYAVDSSWHLEHHGTTPMWIFQYFLSACHLYSIAALLIALYLACWVWESWLPTSDNRTWAQAAMLLSVRRSQSVWLYHVATQGSLYCSHHACGFSMGSTLTRHTYWDWISSHTAWWLLGTPSPNAR